MKKSVLFLLPTCLLCLPCQIAAEEFELEDVVVTASRVEQKVKEAPVAVDVITTTELEQIKFRNPAEVLSRSTGVFSHDFGGESELTSIRIPTHFTNPYTITLVDGVPTSSYGSGSSSQIADLNSDNIARIEIIKGPASAIYGSNAIGGIINVITKDPVGKPQVKVWSEIGDYSQLRGGLSGSASGNKASFNIDLNRIDGDGWREHSQQEKSAANLKLQFVPTDVSLLDFKFDFTKSVRNAGDTISEKFFNEEWQHSYHTFASSKAERIAPSLTYTRFLDNAEFKTTLVMRDLQQEVIPTYRIGIGRRGATGVYSEIDSQDFDLQLLYNRDIAWKRSKLIFGIDTERGATATDTYALAIDYTTTADGELYQYTDYTVGDLSTSLDVDTDIWAPFLQLEVSPLTDLRLTAGGRYDSASYDATDKLDSGLEGKKDFSRFTPKVGATYEFTPRLSSYLSYSQGFVAPSASQLLTSSGANPDLAAEKATNYEIGLRGLFWQEKARYDLSLYFMAITDKILSQGPWGDSTYLNVGETSHDGLELSTSVKPIDMATISFAYTYAENKFDVFTNGTADYSGNWAPRSPKHRFSARLALTPMAGLTVELEMDEVSTQYHDEANLFEYSRPTLFNLRSTYDWREWSCWVHVKNLTDRQYATYVGTDNDEPSYYSGEPLAVFAGVSYTWGK